MNRRERGLVILLITGTLTAYLPALCGGYIWDDDQYVFKNPTLSLPGGLWAIWTNSEATPQYYPLVHTTYWIEYRLWEFEPFGYHLTNVILHVINSLLLWRLLCFCKIPGAWVAAAIFAVHPVQVESVAWITERKNVLSGCFYLLSMLAYLQFEERAATTPARVGTCRWYTMAIACYVAALLSKTVAVSLPAALLLLLWWRAGHLTWRQIRSTLPLFVIGLPLALLTVWLEKHQVGARGADWNFSWIDRFLIAGRAVCFYAGKLLWPEPLIFSYPRWEIDATAWWQYLFPLGVAATLIGLWLARHRTGRGPLAAVLFFVGTLFPALGFFDVYPMRFSFVADHFQYLASIGPIVLIVAGATQVLQRFRWGIRTGQVCCAFVLLILAGLTWRQGSIYDSAESLWKDTLQKNPRSWLAWVNLSDVRVGQQRKDESMRYLRIAIEINPRFAPAHDSLGNLLMEFGRVDEAREQFEQAIAVEPDYFRSYNNLGNLHFKQGEHDRAAELFLEAIRLRPKYGVAHHNLGAVFQAKGRVGEAIEQYQMALEFQPDNPQTHVNLAMLYNQGGQRQRAIQHLRVALQLNPKMDEAHQLLLQLNAQ